jgi:polyisoprenoid-binding protein YceI
MQARRAPARIRAYGIAVVTVGILAAGFPGARPAPVPAQQPAARVPEAPRLAAWRELVAYDVDTNASSLYVLTGRSGLLSFLGHEHVIVPTDWRAELCLANPVPPDASGTLRIRTASLVIDDERDRLRAGLGSGPGEADRREIQDKLLDPRRLAAEPYPEIRIEALALEAERDGSVQANVDVTLRGTTRTYRTRIQLRHSEGSIQLAGKLTLRQTEFGIVPEVVARVVRVTDAVDLHFQILATPTTIACPSAG